MASGEQSDLSVGGRLRRGLQTSVVDNSSAFGFSITITASFGTLSRLHGQPGFGEIFGFALAAVAAFTVLQALASSGFRTRPGTAPREVVMLGTALNLASVGLGVGAATLAGLVLDSSVAWPLGAFLAAFVYVLAEALELTVAARVEDGLMAELQREIEHHVQEEEGEMLPRLREAVDQQALDELGQALDQAKQTAPTRPHPQAPDEPPGLALAGPVATIYDRLRDRLQGRPQT